MRRMTEDQPMRRRVSTAPARPARDERRAPREPEAPRTRGREREPERTTRPSRTREAERAPARSTREAPRRAAKAAAPAPEARASRYEGVKPIRDALNQTAIFEQIADMCASDGEVSTRDARTLELLDHAVTSLQACIAGEPLSSRDARTALGALTRAQAFVDERAGASGVTPRTVKDIVGFLGELMAAHLHPRGAGRFVLPGILLALRKKKPAVRGGVEKPRPGNPEETYITTAKPARMVVKIRPNTHLTRIAQS